MSDEAVFATTPGAVVAGTGFSELPLAAQQLVFDQIAAFTVGSITSTYEWVLPDLHDAIEQYSGSFSNMASDASAALATRNEAILTEMAESPSLDGGAFVNRVSDTNEKWLGLVSDLGYPNDGGYADFSDWYVEGSFDPEPFIEVFQEEAFAPNRPGA